jgi:hypothetical protein
MSNWVPPDEEWIEAQVRREMADYKPPEITAEMLSIYTGSDYAPIEGNPHRITPAALGSYTLETSMEFFHLTEEERIELEHYLANPPQAAAMLHELNLCIVRITERVKPLYAEERGMAQESLNLIDRATGLLAEIEDTLLEQQKTAGEVKANLLALHRGNETKH